MNFKKNGKVFMSKLVGIGPSFYEKRIYRAAVSQRLRNTELEVQTVEGKDPKWRPVVCEGEMVPCRSEEREP